MGKESKLIDVVIEAARKRGHDVRIRDVAYAILRVKLDDAFIAHSVVFGTADDKTIKAYESLASVGYLIDWFTKDFAQPENEPEINIEELIGAASKNSEDDITFEENKAAIIALIARTEEAMEQGKIDLDKGLKICADLRVKLNDKFGAAEKSNEQYIIVQPKCNKICPHTRKECWEMTEEFAMKHFHLIKDPAYKI